MNNPSVRDTLTDLGLAPSKNRGQNFLKDRGVVDLITDAVLDLLPITSQKNVLEIGPGLGALTFPLLAKGARVWAVEFDKGLAQNLSKYAKDDGCLTVINNDILKFDPEELAIICQDNGLALCGNLPYNISSQILFWFLGHLKMFSGAVFMLQKEMADRLMAKEGSKDYGRLGAAISLWCDVKRVLTVSPAAFHPRPKIDSTVVSISALAQEPAISIDAFGRFTAIAFAARRKTLFNNLSKAFGREKTADVLRQMDLPDGVRAEKLAPAVLADLALQFGMK